MVNGCFGRYWWFLQTRVEQLTLLETLGINLQIPGIILRMSDLD